MTSPQHRNTSRGKGGRRGDGNHRRTAHHYTPRRSPGGNGHVNGANDSEPKATEVRKMYNPETGQYESLEIVVPVPNIFIERTERGGRVNYHREERGCGGPLSAPDVNIPPDLLGMTVVVPSDVGSLLTVESSLPSVTGQAQAIMERRRSEEDPEDIEDVVSYRLPKDPQNPLSRGGMRPKGARAKNCGRRGSEEAGAVNILRRNPDEDEQWVHDLYEHTEKLRVNDSHHTPKSEGDSRKNIGGGRG
eukprot:CAMPEP_0194323282 /NCGR_PEP_ID=MMETSP0171-20130528/24976_1 /TAXON_ID=218684 /ORGANISM="Corethron pennatum, Strain L29A3" /LENGTH=246 /DNA_ID=CAMNT_0039081865 /DNA_START=69 /DNA_END=805 /DNA_ORIENTATION=+